MLPFLKNKKEASASVEPDTITREPDDGAEEFDSLHAAAEDLLNAVESKNVPAIAEALRAAFELCGPQQYDDEERA